MYEVQTPVRTRYLNRHIAYVKEWFRKNVIFVMKDSATVVSAAVYIAVNVKYTNFCFYGGTLLKIRVIEKMFKKNCSEFDFLQKTQRVHMSISPGNGAKGLQRLPCLKCWNGKVD